MGTRRAAFLWLRNKEPTLALAPPQPSLTKILSAVDLKSIISASPAGSRSAAQLTTSRPWR